MEPQGQVISDIAMLASKIKRLCLVAVLCFVAPATVSAQTAKANRPDVYTVNKGDTLWDISARFLNEPWLWPEIWQANPQIKNPHLIYPGDEVSLVFEGGRPRLRVRRYGRPTVKLSPSVRVVSRGATGIPGIPIDAISQFLSRPRVLGEDVLDTAPYIVSVGKEHLIAGTGFRVYARGPGLASASRFSVFRQGSTYIDPESKEVLGYEALHLGDAVMDRPGDPATLRLVQSHREILAGDRLLPVEEEVFDQMMLPKEPAQKVDGSIIEVVEGVTQIGQYQIVVLNVGDKNGIGRGHVLSVWQKGATVVDKLHRDPHEGISTPESLIENDAAQQGGLDGLTTAADRVVRDIQRSIHDVIDDNTHRVTLPSERAGTIMVFRAFERISYALVMDAERPMHVLDRVANP
ncbi:MAG: hypothetical protein ACI8PT_004230 [Gammaproteobacteria bacterium]